MRRAAVMSGLSLGAALLCSCGRSGFLSPSSADLTVGIAAPPGVALGCPAAVRLTVQNGNGPVAGVRALRVETDLGQIVAPAGGGSPVPVLGRSAVLSTTTAGTLTVHVVYEGGSAALPLHDTLAATVVGGAITHTAGFDYRAGLPPSLTEAMSLGGASLDPIHPVAVPAESLVDFSVAVTSSDDGVVDPSRIRWASDGAPGGPMDPFAGDLDGAPGGSHLRLRVPLGPHLLYAEYSACTGVKTRAVFRPEGGVRHADLVGTPTLAAAGVANVDADRNDPDRAWLGFSSLVNPQLLTLGTSGTPDVQSAGGPFNASTSIRWGGGTTWWMTFAAVNGVDQFDSTNPTILPTSTTANPFDHPYLFTSSCAPGQAFGFRTTTTDLEFYVGGGNFNAVFAPTAMDAMARPAGQCALLAGGNSGLGYTVTYLLATGATLTRTLHEWDPPLPIQALGFMDPEVWIAAGDGLYRIPDVDAPGLASFPTLNHAQKVFPASGLPADLGFPAGFPLTGISRVVGGRNGTVGQLWIATTSPGSGQEGLMRMVEVTPRDANGSSGSPVLLAAPLEEPLLQGRHVSDVGVLREFDGTVDAPFPVWAATPQGVIRLTWSH